MKNKGFILVETIITTVFVLGLFSFLIANVLPLVGQYEKTLDYDSSESKYDAHLIRKMIIKDNSCRTRNLLDTQANGYYEFEKDEICYYLNNMNYCQKLLSKDFLDVKKIIVTEYNTTKIKNHQDNFERSIKEYVDYIPKYNNTTGAVSSYSTKRRLIILFNDGRITNVELLFDDDTSIVCGGAIC